MRIEHFALYDAGTDEMRWSFDGVLTPVSMRAFSQALGWPALGGTLSGVVPAVNYSRGRIEIEGMVLMNVFDGDVLLRNLRLRDPFSDTPVLSGDIEFRPFDLGALTRAFSFGNIEGRLEGEVTGLRLVRWLPVAFDARFATPAGDRSSHRISQRAVDNLSSLGGASVSGALQSTYMGLFKEFSYDRIGLSCMLRDGVCQMDGISPAKNGYYIVKGGLVPPVINVVGFNHQIDWDVLLERVRNAIHASAPVIQ